MATAKLSNKDLLLQSKDIFFLMLEGVFDNWDGDWDLLFSDTNEYLPAEKSKKATVVFYNAVRKDPIGKSVAIADDIEHAKIVHNTREPLTYIDHIGLVNVAVPVFVDGVSFATIFFGRILDRKFDQGNYLNKIRLLERKGRFIPNELTNLATKIPQITLSQLERTKEKAVKLSNYVETLVGGNKLDSLVSQAYVTLDKLLLINSILQTAIRSLNDAFESWELFWIRVNEVLSQSTKAIDAAFAIVMYPTTLGEKRSYIVPSSGPISSKEFAEKEYTLKENISNSLKFDYAANRYDYLPDFTIFSDEIEKADRLLEPRLGHVKLAGFGFGNAIYGLIAVFFRKDDYRENSRLKDNEENSIIEHLAAIIGTAANHQFIEDQHKKIQVERERNQEHIEKQTHQLFSPLHLLIGATGMMDKKLERWMQDPLYFQNWEPNQIQWLDDTIKKMQFQVNELVQLADNLVHDTLPKMKDKPAPVLIYNMGGFLIAITKQYNLLAKENGNKQIYVDYDTFESMNERILIDEVLFRRVFFNLIHNAIKYSSSNSVIKIKGFCEQNRAFIHIINDGEIPVREDEVEKIFLRGYRSTEAQNFNAPGTGIGLSAARDWITVQGGNINVQPSQPLSKGWRTTFTISLPLKS